MNDKFYPILDNINDINLLFKICQNAINIENSV